MKIAELFVGLGVKGADTAGKALGGVKTGLSDVKSMSFEAKAAIIGVIYGLERLMSQSAQMGTGLSNFNALTGIGTKELQQWQYAARQAGVSGEELTGSVKAVQTTMANMQMNKGAPEGFAMVANKVGFDMKKSQDTLYVMGQLQKFLADKSIPAAVGNHMAKSWGLSEGTMAAMRKNVFTEDNFKKAPTYSDKEVGTLNKVDVAWSNLGQKIQMAMGHLTAKHGMTLVKDVDKLAVSLLKLVDALIKLGEQTKILEKFGKVIDFFSDAVESKPGTVLGEKHMEKKALSWIADASKQVMAGNLFDKDMWKSDKNKKVSDVVGAKPFIGPMNNPNLIAAPKMAPTGPKPKTQNVNVNQTLNFQHDGKDAVKTGKSVNKAVRDAYRQMQPQVQGA